MNKRIIVLGLVILAVLSLIHINQGSVDLSVRTIVGAIFKYDQSVEHDLIRDLRLPRLVIGIIAGGSLAISGVLFQSLMRNPLASASTLGVSAGSYFSVVLFSVFFSGFRGIPFFPALVGALIAAIVVLILGKGRGADPVRMTLAGVALSLVFSSMTSALQLLFEHESKGLFLWGAGSLVQNSWRGVKFALPLVLVCLAFSLIISRKIDIMQLGDDTASSLGLNVVLYRYIGIGIGILATSSVVAVVGPIAFVGIVAPHIVKRLGVKKTREILVSSFVLGAVVLVGADALARAFTSGSYELPVGAFTAIIGGPWLIYLAFKTGKNMGNSSYGLLVQTGKKRLAYKALVIGLCLVILLVFVLSLGNGGSSFLRSATRDFVIARIRLPRIVTALLAGIVLAISGFLLQTVLNNTLADPSTLGVTPGAALGALVAIYFLKGSTSLTISISAFIGALAAAAVIFIISKRSKYNPIMLILVGMAVTAICDAAVNIIVINTTVGKSASLVWLAGSTYGRNWTNVMTLLVAILTLGPIAWLLCRNLDAVMLGQDIATAIGTNVQRIRLLSSLVGILLAAIGVATVGTVGFIGLLAPHMARFLTGIKHRKNLVVTGLLGGLLLMTADLIGRVVIYPSEIPSGLVVSIIGAPYFLWLLYSTSKLKR